ncbi:LAMI_0D03180g1_1 [Lachancea mirantina]|uniref:LAMI_0D03180g1_1 n=1 Tax=Lachancea mirantina TaxID=1230905 RepID=A0A1G4J9L0_9SACH|nr:LAMI_0D03180g1_1 [Lachancea mirantina]
MSQNPSSANYAGISRRDIMARYFNLSAPVGHAGVPLPESCFEPASATVEETSEIYDENTDKTGEIILNLPIELKVKITQKLSQYDLVNLARTSRAFYDAAMISLYENVVVDSNYSYLNDPLSLKGNFTFIKSKYNLKKFMGLLSGSVPAPFPMGVLVKSLRILSLPDGVTQHELKTFVYGSLPTMSRLSRFYWDSDCYVLPASVLEIIPSKKEVSALSISLDFSRPEQLKLEPFDNVQKLSLRPFLNFENLGSFAEHILLANRCLIEKLETLQLFREVPSLLHRLGSSVSSSQALIVTQYMMANNVAQPSNAESDRVVQFNQVDVGLWRFLDPIVGKKRRFESLASLEIDSVSLVPEDAQKLRAAVNLENLRHLSLTRVDEIRFLPDVDYEVHDMGQLAIRHPEPGFLAQLSPYLAKLTSLRLDYREPFTDSVGAFIAALESGPDAVTLHELDVTIHWDAAKSGVLSPTWELLAQNYVDAVLRHSNTLTKLSLIGVEDSRFYKRQKPLPANLLTALRLCTSLRSLRIHGQSLHPSGDLLIHDLPTLALLDLVGKEAGGPAHMGLQVIHAGVLDSWYRVIHVAITLAQNNPALRFIRIDKCLFECGKSGNVSPKSDSLLSWFKRHTRVMLSAEDF